MKLQNTDQRKLVVNSFLYNSIEEINEIRKRFNLYINNFDDKNFEFDNENLLQNYNIENENKK